MAKYTYTPLDPDSKDIRLVELHPAAFDDPIQISIITKPFLIPKTKPIPGGRLAHFQRSLDAYEQYVYVAFENLEGRIGFWNVDEGTTAWDHPDPTYSDARYDSDETSLGVAQLSFEALSYTWGSNEDPAEVEIVEADQRSRTQEQCRGFSAARIPLDYGPRRSGVKMRVQRNLSDALKHLRYADSARTLWCDAISVNQEDVTERSHQVTRMGDIYKYAKRVIVWLGLPAFESSRALRLLERVGREVEFSRGRQVLPAPGYKPETFPIFESSTIDDDEQSWVAVDKLLSRPWFTRVWIIQEIKLANSSALIQCGETTVEWRLLRRGIIVCTGLKFPSPAYRKLTILLGDRYSLAFTSRYPDPLSMLLHVVAARLCSNPRDKIFGLLGLLPPELTRRIQPQYTDSPREVFRKATIAYIECTGSLDILSLSGPSWIPDWSVWRSALGRENDHCGSNSTAEVSCVDSDVLMVTGASFDSIVAVGGRIPTVESAKKDQDIIRFIYHLWLKGTSKHQTYPTGESIAEACAWTINSGILSDRWGKQLNGAVTLAEAQLIFQQILDLDQSGDSESNYTAKLHKGHIDGFLFCTAKGYFGICFNDVLPGDEVSVFLGCSFAAILRPQPDDKYLFVGCAYVHGIMDGEALLGPLPPGWKAVIRTDVNGDQQQKILNTSGEETLPDPRFGELAEEWEAILAPDRVWPEKEIYVARHRITGQLVYSDPRLLPDALRARGVSLRQFALV